MAGAGEPSSSSSSAIPDSDRVVDALRADGTLEHLRTLALEVLERDEALRERVEAAVLGSRALRNFAGDRCSKQLISQLSADLSSELSREALRALWRVLSAGPEAGGISQQIDAAVHAVLAQQRDAQLRPPQQQQPAAAAAAPPPH